MPKLHLGELHQLCENAPRVPDLADIWSWKNKRLNSPNKLLDVLQRRAPALFAPPPEGFGFKVGRAILATWHMREMPDNRGGIWGQTATLALDAIANAVALWRLWKCKCGLPLRAHGVAVFDKLVTAQERDEMGRTRNFRFNRPALHFSQCGELFRAPAWFLETRAIDFPHSPNTCEPCRLLVRKVAREFLWSCLARYYGIAFPNLEIPKHVKQCFVNAQADERQRLMKDEAGALAGAVVRDAANEVERAFKVLAKAGLAGAGIGAMMSRGDLLFDVR